MRVLALYASKNTHDVDATGAFIPEAKAFAKSRLARGDTVEVVAFDNLIADRAVRRARFLELIRKAQPFDLLAYFGHGLRTGLPSAGFTTLTLDSLVREIHGRCEHSVRIVLYACSTAGAPGKDRDRLDGDGGFADLLRDRLSVLGHIGWVDAHSVPGHTTINRMTRRFYLDGVAGGAGGTWLVAPGSPEWPVWSLAIKNDRDFRYSFPTMSESEIHAYLATRKP